MKNKKKLIIIILIIIVITVFTIYLKRNYLISNFKIINANSKSTSSEDFVRPGWTDTVAGWAVRREKRFFRFYSRQWPFLPRRMFPPW